MFLLRSQQSSSLYSREHQIGTALFNDIEQTFPSLFLHYNVKFLRSVVKLELFQFILGRVPKLIKWIEKSLNVSRFLWSSFKTGVWKEPTYRYSENYTFGMWRLSKSILTQFNTNVTLFTWIVKRCISEKMGSSRNTTRKRSTRRTRIKAQRSITTLLKKPDNQRIIMGIESIHQIIQKSKLLHTTYGRVAISLNTVWWNIINLGIDCSRICGTNIAVSNMFWKTLRLTCNDCAYEAIISKDSENHELKIDCRILDCRSILCRNRI